MLTGLGSIIGSGWLFGAVVILAIALTYAELGAMFLESGGMVRYARYSHGALVGFIAYGRTGLRSFRRFLSKRKRPSST